MRRANPLTLVLLLALTGCTVEVGGLGPVAEGGPNPGGPGATPDPVNPGPTQGNTDPWVGAVPASADAAVTLPEPAEIDAAAMPDPSAVDAATSPQVDAQAPGPFTLASPDFAEGERMPTQFTCSGGHQTPAFAWTGAPAKTHSFALVLTTPTSVLGSEVTYTRWAIWNVAAERVALPAQMAVPEAAQVSNESDLGLGAGALFGGAGGGLLGGGGSDGNAGHRYRGPCSRGLAQTFAFTLYALDGTPPYPDDWSDKVTADEVREWLESSAHVLGRASLRGISP